MPVEIRLLKDEEAAKANDFHNFIYKSNRTLQQFLWEFFNGPWGKAIYVVAVDTELNDKIVGSYCAIPINMIDSTGKTIRAVKGEDVLVDPDYRKGNTYLQIAAMVVKKCNEAGIEYYWSLGNNEVHNKLMKFNIDYYGQQGVFVINVFKSCKFLSALNPENKFIDYLKIFGLCVMSGLSSIKNIFNSSNFGTYQFKQVKNFNNIDLFQKSVDKGTLYMLIKEDENYLKWRLSDNPYPNHYKEFVLQNNDGEALAHAVINRRKEGFAYIDQILFNTILSKKHKTAFVKRLLAEFKKENVFLIRAFGVNSNQYNKEHMNILQSLGFIFIKRGLIFQWKALKLGDKNFSVKNVIISRMYIQGNV